jgi:type IV secretory pathway VirB4 component
MTGKITVTNQMSRVRYFWAQFPGMKEWTIVKTENSELNFATFSTFESTRIYSRYDFELGEEICRKDPNSSETSADNSPSGEV